MTQTTNELNGKELKTAYRQVAAFETEKRSDEYMREAIDEAIADGACTIEDVCAWAQER